MNFRTEPISVPDVPFLTLAEVCRLIGYDDRTVQRWIDRGLFPPSRPVAGGRRAWTARSVGVWMAWQDYCPVPAEEGGPAAEPKAEGVPEGESGGEGADLAARPKRRGT